MPHDDVPSSKKLKEEFPTQLPVQGPDPIKDEMIGMHYFARFNGTGFSPYPAFVRNFLRKNVWPSLLTEPETDGIFMDRIFLYTTINFPVWFYLLVFADYENNKVMWGAMFFCYVAIWFDQFASYILAMHCIVHRSILNTQSSAVARQLKVFFIWVLGPVMGTTPETYNAHHVHMHHPMNNGYDDLSTTLTYQRDSKWDFARYLGRFLIAHFELWGQLSKRNPRMAHAFVRGELAWMAAGLLLYIFRPVPCALLYVLPVLIVRLGMTAGNFGQHAFINPTNPFINTCQSCVVVNSVYNTIAFNDGYHIQHHEYPIAAYHELPYLFNKMLPVMAADDSIVFDGRGEFFDFVAIWSLLFTNNFDELADRFVDCKALVNKTKPRTKEQIVQMLKERTRPIYDPKVTKPENFAKAVKI